MQVLFLIFLLFFSDFLEKFPCLSPQHPINVAILAQKKQEGGYGGRNCKRVPPYRHKPCRYSQEQHRDKKTQISPTHQACVCRITAAAQKNGKIGTNGCHHGTHRAVERYPPQAKHQADACPQKRGG